MSSSRSAAPLSDARHEPVTFYKCRECMELFSPKEKIGFSEMGWAYMLAEPSHFCSLSFLELILLLEGKGAAFLKPHPSRTFSHVCTVKWHLQGPETPQHASLRWKQEPENVLQSHETPHAGDHGQNERTDKVERLTDNRRGLSVVIYNRDCKMVNQIWS